MKPLTADSQQTLRYGSVAKYWENFARRVEISKDDTKTAIKEFLRSRKAR